MFLCINFSLKFIQGFKKIDTDHWQFANEFFIKGQKHLLKNITRRKQPQGLVQKKSSQQKDENIPEQSEEDKKRVALWKEVEILKTDKNALTQQLKKLRQHQQVSQSKMLLVREQLQGMEKNQQQMLSFIVMAMQSPEFLVQFFQPKENTWRVSETGKNKLSEVIDDCEPQTPSDGMIVPYQPPKEGDSVPPSTTEASNLDDLMEFDFSSDEMRDLFMDIDFLLGPMDDKLVPLENHGQLVLPDIPENDTMLEELLSKPSSEACTELNGSDDGVDEYQDQNTVGTGFGSQMDTSEKVEDLTKQMGSLTSEIKS